MRQRTKTILTLSLGAVIGAAAIISFSFRERNEAEEPVSVNDNGRLQYKWYAPELPRNVQFAGEKVPLERWEVREALDRELLVNSYSHSQTLYALKLAKRYFPMIEERLKANGVPDDFKYLCVAESHLQNQTSRAGAVGFWQFMKDTGPHYGLVINDDVDERYNVRKSTDAACMYLKQAHAKFGSWTAAAASYNCGQGGYNGHSTFQQVNNYYETMLPEETMRYVFRIVALKYIISNPERMGFMLQPEDEYKPVKTRTVKVTSSISDLAQWSIDNGSSYKMLKTLNPWLRSRKLPVPAGKSYDIELPAS
ncbi:MAG: lytic transglycosylase domain-containing protein [Flavipsychrobacter sp.]|nr:lytic transglycosylase domain-containing protein [Flavipsychrobacter sp.]